MILQLNLKAVTFMRLLFMDEWKQGQFKNREIKY